MHCYCVCVGGGGGGGGGGGPADALLLWVDQLMRLYCVHPFVCAAGRVWSSSGPEVLQPLSQVPSVCMDTIDVCSCSRWRSPPLLSHPSAGD